MTPTRRSDTIPARIVAVAVLTAAVLGGAPGVAQARTFDPTCVISDTSMRAAGSMSAAQVQTFLARKNSLLTGRSFARHDNGSIARASTLIWEAAESWGISEKVMLTLLQKEQTLITRRWLAAHTLERAVGAGCPDAYTNKFPGFGPQVWHGARLLDGYGEDHKTTPYVPHPWYPGLLTSFTGEVGRVDTLGTYKLYVYNPSIGAEAPYGDLSHQECSGNANFWKIYWAWWGDPVIKPSATSLPQGSHTMVLLDQQYAQVPYDRGFQLAGTVHSVPPAASAGAVVEMQCLGRRGWTTVRKSGVLADSSGRFVLNASGSRLQRLRAIVVTAAGIRPVVSGMFVADKQAVLTTPTVGNTGSAAVVARIGGAVRPAHASTVEVTLQRSSAGVVRETRAFTARTGDSGSWALKVLLRSGSWTARARHQDAGHARSQSGSVRFTVR